MIELSDNAEKALDGYLRQVRAYLRGTKSVDVDEVEQNITEHIQNEFEGATKPISFEKLDAVLKKLGSPRQWVSEKELAWRRKIIQRLRADPEDMHKTVPAFKDIWLGWEKLRIYYNAPLLVEGLVGLSYLRHLGEKAGHRCPNIFGSHVWVVIITFAVLANVFYCLGPLAEISLVALRIRWTRRARHLLFTVGLLFSTLIILGLAIRGYAHISGYLR